VIGHEIPIRRFKATTRSTAMASEPEKPIGSFEDYIHQGSDMMKGAAAGPSQKAHLFAKGAPIGWLGEDSSQWCVVTGQDAAVTIEPYVYSGVLYYRNAADTSRYLSVSDGYNYVGFYNWWGARGWTLNGDILTSLYTNAQLSYWSSDNGYVYANAGSGYTPLTVQFS
jgi:hypothetical protein